MNVLVTGAKGFIGKNLIAELRNKKDINIFEYARDTEYYLLDKFCKEADFVFHLAGVNRPKDQSEYNKGNYEFTSTLLNTLKKHDNRCTVLTSSSIQAELENPYGVSKKAMEDLLISYNEITGAKVLIYRLPNVFGKWSKPNYNSVVATFCHNIANNLPINVNDPDVVMNLVYIDDVVNELYNALQGKEKKIDQFCEVPEVYSIKLGEIADLIFSFKESRKDFSIPNFSDQFTKKLYSTYLSFLPKNQFGYDLKMNIDHRGSFTEFIKTPDRGQVSVNVSKSGITKGNHWHHTKNEKFLVVSGKALIKFRRLDSEEIIEYFVNGEKMEVVDIPTGYVHNITNIGECDLITIMWANEAFNPKNADTHFMEV